MLIFGIGGTASRRQDQGAGHLPRPGGSSRSQLRPALDLPGGWATLGRTPLGLAGRRRPRYQQGTPPQEALGQTDGHEPPLAAAATPGAGGRRYAVLDLLHCCQSLREPVTLIARLRLLTRHQPGQNGRPPLKGPRRKTLLDQADVWTGAEVAWYDGTTRIVELTSQTAVWYRSGKPPVLIRWVLIRDPQGAFDPQTGPDTDPGMFVLRVEVSFQVGPTWVSRPSASGPTWPSPALLGRTTLAAHALQKRHPMIQRRAA